MSPPTVLVIPTDRCRLCDCETCLSAPPIEMRLNHTIYTLSCERVHAVCDRGSNRSTPTWQPNWPWHHRELRALCSAQSSWRRTTAPRSPVLDPDSRRFPRQTGQPSHPFWAHV